MGFNPKTLNLFAARPAPPPRWRSGKVRDCHAIGRGFDPRSVQQIFVSLFLFFFLYCCRARSLRPSSRSHRRRHRACLDQLLQTGSVPEGFFSPATEKKIRSMRDATVTILPDGRPLRPTQKSKDNGTPPRVGFSRDMPTETPSDKTVPWRHLSRQTQQGFVQGFVKITGQT